MADEQKNLPLSAEISAAINKAESTDEIQAALTSARETKPPESVIASPPPPPELFTDTFIIGGKEVEISGADAGEVLRQYKAAMTAYDLGRREVEPQQPTAPVKTAEEIQADKFELESSFRLGKISAKEYLEKSGAVDEYFKDRGIDPAEIKEVLNERKGAKAVKSWEQATTEFTTKFNESGTPWPGGPRVLDLMGKTLVEMGLTDKPSPDSLQQAYDHLTKKGWDLVEIGKEDAAAAAPAKPAPAPVKKKLGASGVFNVAGGQGARDMGKQVDAPKIDENDTPASILEKWKQANLAAGRNPDDALREQFGAPRVQ